LTANSIYLPPVYTAYAVEYRNRSEIKNEKKVKEKEKLTNDKTKNKKR